MVSNDIAWAVIRNNSSYLLKKRGVKKPFSTEPMNLTSLNSQRYSGLVNSKAVGIVATSDNKGVVFTTKRSKGAKKPARSTVSANFKGGSGRVMKKVRAVMGKQRYRKDLTKAALRKASAIVKSQKPLPPRKGARSAAKSE